MRWVNVRPEHTISWSVQPHKKSLNFGIFKHPGQVGPVAASSTDSTDEIDDKGGKDRDGKGNVTSAAIDKLSSLGLQLMQWVGRCEADKISQGTYDVGRGQEGNYGLVFDNTFSKQVSKTATFVLLTYPINAPPQSGVQIHHSKTVPLMGSDFSHSTPAINPAPTTTNHSLAPRPAPTKKKSTESLQTGPQRPQNTRVHTGVLYKRRRKRHQGYAPRFFSLDFESSTLSYYHDRNSSALRGAIPLSLAAIATNEASREISIDSGTEIWHLRAANPTDFVSWKEALEKGAKGSKEAESKKRVHHGARVSVDMSGENRRWDRAEQLVDKIVSCRDLVRRLARDTDPKYLTTPIDHRGRDNSPKPNGDSSEMQAAWKVRHLEREAANSARQAIGGDKVVHQDHPEPTIHDDLLLVLDGLSSSVAELSDVIRARPTKLSLPVIEEPRRSIGSDVTREEFFDATDGDALLTLQRDSDNDDPGSNTEGVVMVEDEDSGSDRDDDNETLASNALTKAKSSSLYPAKPRSLTPLPVSPVRRRTKITTPTVTPPSLISFLRKNVGKDLSAISMPVSANEPTSLLQRAAEGMEYSELLDKAAASSNTVERLLFVTAFAISGLASGRVKERAMRKPFNPMLGESYELVREDKGFRFISEKVSHRPVQLAFQADGHDWSLAQSPRPTQQFWGKSAEVVTEGRLRLSLHSVGEHYSWLAPTCFLRNIIAGEKYIEPVGEMTVVNETTGDKSVTRFKAGGLFSGRSEELTTTTYAADGKPFPLGIEGTWTNVMTLSTGDSANGTANGYSLTPGTTIWTAGPLVDNPHKNYGFPLFTATLNEITQLEREGAIPPTDSRLRPDQRALENGDVDDAERLKAQLEEGQRARRRQMEAKNGDGHDGWMPRWFAPTEEADSGGETAWRLKDGRDSYWEERARKEWTGVVPVLSV